MNIKLLCTILFAGFLTSCADTKNNKLIIGNWTGAEWIVNGSPSSQNPKETSFTFDDKGNYTFSFAGVVEKGTYNVENEMLFTKPTDQQEIMVRISKLTKDSLIFDMNRGGLPEILILTRKN